MAAWRRRGEWRLEIIRRVNSKALRSTFDTGNFLLVDEDPLRALDMLLPYIGHVHVKDFRETVGGRYQSLGGKTYEGADLGQGAVPLVEIVKRLERAGYKGELVLEYEGTGDEAEGIRASDGSFEKLLTRISALAQNREDE
ncbi:sugar phosphate isomerase/epimerase family protein [Paenibacillus thermoaerophilus]|uniref:Sugar phosphate isomerase/epimerase family protein n=1 Tax=Paenibacillus thermoaerophilus TaxID=1215385 RepID=A0ABW2UZ84_9BACL|nr:sugar phosphate isomerase/epimerase [Paenibacillus thermoaerophilus]TMV17460.1 sugar phosphate isomerase/epimerase [Paenibacillus thermoaerophilus]